MRAIALGAESVQEEPDHVPVDWDAEFEAALTDRLHNVALSDGAAGFEHPTQRIFRVGIESIRAGAPSELFLIFLEHLALRAELDEVLRLVFPKARPIKEDHARSELQKDAIVRQFRKHIKAYLHKKAGRQVSFAEAKRTFKAQARGYSAKTIDRALTAHGLNVPARRGAR